VLPSLDKLSRRRRTPAERSLQTAFDFGPEPALPAPVLAEAPVPEPLRPPSAIRSEGPPLRIGVLGSGSGGNGVVVESGPHRILIDAGFSAREIKRRLAFFDVDPASLGALVLTHEHVDHCRGADRLAKRYSLPVLATAGTLREARLGEQAAGQAAVIRSGEPFEIAGFRIEPFGLPHDAREPVGLVVEDGVGRRVGLVADLGCRTALAWARLSDLDVLLLETNHDLDMLRTGPYPWSLKQRVAGRHGHLSNREAAEGLPELIGDRLRWLVLYHLSRTNNLPALAAAAVGEVLDREGCPAQMALTEQFHPTPWLEVAR
jgi:phosphoribosyl 1,2-cyclic phosphodiesterase